jgi:hypothetical protein
MLKEINKTIIIPKVITICFITPLLKPIIPPNKINNIKNKSKKL